ncbi:hypothetical protein NQ314_003847 [Rhamnusium bicolor]|uniref:Uncharacterized protein n=1 Tax=Rhamnusium bicolor TaxID=1586634 RepID=A0AAV8ZL23_9CUCU|nr:hypothetical protein NQ314_003847 [Rhamnusium bicolor]
MPPLVCTQNTFSHVDYGIPIVANKSTDYRTCTGTYHRFIPNIPQEFDCRCKANIKQELKVKDVALRDASKSCYNNDFILKFNQGDPSENCVTAARLTKVHYIRNVEEKMFKNPPPPMAPKLSEMKDSYRMNYYRPNFREITAPTTAGRCLVGKPFKNKLFP